MRNKPCLKSARSIPIQFPKAILFDWDNTLVDTWKVCYESFNIALQATGNKPVTLKQFWEQPHHSARDSRHHFGDDYEKGEKIFYDAVKERHLEELIAHEGAESLIKTLKGRGIYLGIVSNKEGNLLRKEVSHLGWTDHFHQVVGSRDVEEDKPSPLPVLAALKQTTLCPKNDEIWFVGDSVVDVHCARATGCVPLVVGEGPAAFEEDVVHVKTCQGITDLLEGLE